MRAGWKGSGIVLAVGLFFSNAWVGFAVQPKVAPGPNEPNWADLLKQQWALDIDRDLRNPLEAGVSPAALFRRADKNRPVVFEPVMALGLATTTHGGWYVAGGKASDVNPAAKRHEAWSYVYKPTDADIKLGRWAPVTLRSGQKTIDPGDRPFGLWIRNDAFDDGGVFTQPGMVAVVNDRLKGQPYKAMIYPNCDSKTGRLVPDSYIIGWEYSTNDDFQDVVTRIDNVTLLPADPPLKGILASGATVKKLAGGFKFIEGPAWDFNHQVLYFSDIPRTQIIRYVDGKTSVANGSSGGANGLMFSADGMLVACERDGRRVSRAIAGKPAGTIVARYNGKRFNAPNDLWIDEAGGIYFTDPYYGKDRDLLEQDKEAVYYVAKNGTVTRLIGDLIRPNGIALSPDGKQLYVVDHGAAALYRYPVVTPGKVGQGERIAYVTFPDGMTVDAQGRLYVAGKGGIWVLSANGKWIGLIAMPERPSNCTFGGAGQDMLFITARTSLYGIETQTRGWHVHLDGVPQ